MESDMTGRAGRYIRQTGGYAAFIPKPLPPDPPLQISPEIHVLLSQADRALGRLDGSIHTLPDADLFVYMYVRQEAVLSSQIEGAQSSLQDLLAAEAEVMLPELPRDVDEVVNYVGAMKYGLERLAELPVSVRLIREIHRELLSGARGGHATPGELRTSQNWIGPAGSPLNNAVFVPPPPGEVAAQLGALEQFIHAETDLPLLVKIGLVHAQFETIHPFLDGNGRVGRLLITFLLCERDVLRKPVLYLSYYFKKHRLEYYDQLQSVRDNGTWERWLTFFLNGVRQVSEQAADTARGIVLLREDHRRRILEGFGRSAGYGHQVLEHLYRYPIISVNAVRELLGTSYPTANTVVARLADCGILREFTGQARNRRYIYQNYIDLFSNAEEHGERMKNEG